MEDAEILERVEAWFPKAKSFWEPHHNRFRRIKKFVRAHGEHAQWDDDQVASRQAVNPPRLTLTENLLGPFCNQVANDLKQSDFGCQVKPKDSGTDVQLAEIRQGLHRGIQQIGGFRNALNKAIDDLIDGGLGAWRFVTRYADPLSFEKEIEYIECDPPHLFHGDGTNRKADFSDVSDSLYFQVYSPESFKAEFDLDPEQFLSAPDTSAVWGTRDAPWVSEYFFKEETEDTLVTCTKDQAYLALIQMAGLKPGNSYYLSEFRAKLKDLKEIGVNPEDLIALDPDGQPITRKTTRCQVWWAKIAGKQVIKKEKWPGYFIPNFLATGREVTVNGEKQFYGLAEPAIDVQKAHNYAFSALVERAGQAPKAQIWMAVESMDPAYQRIYDNLAVWNGVIPFKAFGTNGQALPPPKKDDPIQSDPAFINLRQMTLQGIRDVLGMWETSLGAQSGEKSGIAIQTRERQADTGNADWGINLAREAEHCFRATDEILSKVYDLPTQVRIVGEDDKEKMVTVASLEANDPNHNNYYDLNRGKYDILCKLAPSADTKRDDQVRGLELLFKANPALSTALAPEYIALQDWKNAAQMAQVAKAVRAAQFPNVNFEQPEGQIPPQVQQQMQQMQVQAQQAQEALQQMQPEIQRLQIENQSIKADKSIEAQRLQIEKFKADTDRMKAQADIQVAQGKMLLASDEQKHDQRIENAELVHVVHLDREDSSLKHQAHEHGIRKDTAHTVMLAEKQAHGQQQDREKLGLEGRKLDQAKTATEPAAPGSTSPKPGVKQA